MVPTPLVNLSQWAAPCRERCRRLSALRLASCTPSSPRFPLYNTRLQWRQSSYSPYLGLEVACTMALIIVRTRCDIHASSKSSVTVYIPGRIANPVNGF